MLIVEDDADFARTVLDAAREQSFKGIVALRGDAGLALAHEFKPDAIVLDMGLPAMDGWTVLDHLKHHPATRHIPVHIVSAGDDVKANALRAGAVAFLQKPLEKEQLDDDVPRRSRRSSSAASRNLLVVEDDEDQRNAIVELVGSGDDVEVTAVGSSEEALAAARGEALRLHGARPEAAGHDRLRAARAAEEGRAVLDPAVIVYTGQELTRREETRLKSYAETIIVKDARSPERLLDETSLFLHRVEARLPQAKRRMLEQLHSAEEIFKGQEGADRRRRRAQHLRAHVRARGARHGGRLRRERPGGIETLEANPDVDLVLMDIMMPEMDGYETMAAVRQLPEFKQLPIISLTAKAMKGDREKSIASGASDYITKPVDTDQLLSLMRVWLYR